MTRKLIGFTHNEDELAAVMAHELGHIVTHQQAILFSRVFKDELGVTSVKDRADLLEKFNEMLESKKGTSAHFDEEQEEADRVGIDILARAGYRVNSMSEFWDRFTANKGRKGNWFTDTFGSTGEDSERFRAMLKETVKLPDQCVEKRDPKSEQSYAAWRKNIVAYNRQNRPESVPGLLAKKALNPPLQDQLHTLRFTPDGKYVIAQDNSSIYVLTRDPFQVKFTIPATDAFPVQLTSDSKSVTFYTPDLRIENWDLEKESPTSVFDLHAIYGCLQTALSRDGKTLACLNGKNGLVVVDSASQERIFEKKDIRSGNVAGGWGLYGFHYSYELDYMNMAFSPDGRYLVLAGKDGNLLVDIANRMELPIPGSLKPLIKVAFTFLDDGRIFGLLDASGYKASLASFPQGEIEQTVEFGAAIPSPTSKPGYILMRPIRDYDVGVLDLKSGQIIRANKKPAMDIWGNFAVSEMGSGEIGLFESSSTPVARATLPRGGLADVRAVAVSDDFQWLALSEEQRGAIWNLSSGKRLYNVKSFHGAYFGHDSAYVDFPKQEKMERSIAQLSLGQPGIALADKLGPGRMYQRGPFVISIKKANSDKPDKDPDDEKGLSRFDRYRFEGERIRWKEGISFPETNQTFTVSDATTGKMLWSRTFSKDMPEVKPNPRAGIVAFVWEIGESGAKQEFERSPILASKRKGAKYLDYLIEVADLRTGETVAGMVFSTNDRTVIPKNVVATRKWAAITDNYGRTLVYNLETGACTGKVFGTPSFIAPDSSKILIKYDSRHYSLFDAQNMTRVKDYVFSDPLDEVLLSTAGDKMFAVSDTQKTYLINTDAPKPDLSVEAK